MPCVSVRRGRLGVERTCGEPGASGGTSSWHASGRRWIRNQGPDVLPPLPFLSCHACLVDASLLLGSAFDTSLSSRGNRWKRNHRQPWERTGVQRPIEPDFHSLSNPNAIPFRTDLEVVSFRPLSRPDAPPFRNGNGFGFEPDRGSGQAKDRFTCSRSSQTTALELASRRPSRHRHGRRGTLSDAAERAGPDLPQVDLRGRQGARTRPRGGRSNEAAVADGVARREVSARPPRLAAWPCSFRRCGRAF